MSKSVIIPPGKYFIGDPHFCFYGSMWSVIAEGREEGVVELEYPDGSILLAFTSCNGVVEDTYSNLYSVVSGFIGITPVGRATAVAYEQFGKVVYFPNFTICSFEDGVATFGNYEIDTTSTYEIAEDECA